MAQISVTTTPTVLDAGTAGLVVLKNLGQVAVTVTRGSGRWVLGPSCGLSLSADGTVINGTAASGSVLVDVVTHPAPDAQSVRGPAGKQTRISGAGTLVTSAVAPTLADLAPGEMAVVTDASGNLKVYSNVAGVLKVGTVTVA